jgi:hypothetical protein
LGCPISGQRRAALVTFYTETLGFNLDQQNLPAFAQVSINNLKLILSGPGASGSRPMPDGRQQEPGGWNRIVLQVKDLPTRIADMEKQGVHFRNKMEVGPAVNRFKSKTLKAIRLNCFNRLSDESWGLRPVAAWTASLGQAGRISRTSMLLAIERRWDAWLTQLWRARIVQPFLITSDRSEGGGRGR